jgi:hypothetical protein
MATRKRLEDNPKLKHAQRITHRATDGKFKEPPGTQPKGKIAPPLKPSEKS